LVELTVGGLPHEFPELHHVMDDTLYICHTIHHLYQSDIRKQMLVRDIERVPIKFDDIVEVFFPIDLLQYSDEGEIVVLRLLK
jgi:hypothetical protein